MKKYVLKIITLLTITFVLFGCSNNATTTENSNSTEATMQSLTIGVMPDLDSIPFIIAEQNGFFKDENLTVNIQHFKSAQDRDSALQTGNLDGTISDMLAVIFLNDNNFKVAITSKTEGSFKLISSKNSNIKSTDDLNSKSIGISKNTIIEYLTDRMLEEYNINEDSVEKIAIPKIPTRLEMLSTDKLDSATLPEPLASVAVLSGGMELDSSKNLGINAGVMIFTEDAIQSKEEEIKALYRAYNKAVEYLEKEDTENYIDTIITEAGFPEPVRDTLEIPSYSKASSPSKDEFNAVLKWLKEKELSSSDYSLEDLSNNSLIE